MIWNIFSKSEEFRVLYKNGFILLKKSYYEWRYWDHIVRKLKRNIKLNKDQKEDIKYINRPGIAFSFDDSFRVNHWFDIGKELFGFYDVTVTFNVNAFHHFEEERELNQREIDLLLELQSNGHEIAHHGLKHKRAVDFSNEVGFENWIKEDVESLFYWLEKQSHSKTNDKFKTPVTYAFPHFVSNENTIKALVPKYFKIVRG
jgi:peptidoglycan/xylan/chitin deacetylase (PgdA/CDA1 family)